MLYTITNGTYTAQVDSIGAQMLSLKGPEGFEYIWTGDPAYWTGRSPVLFPIVGGLRGGRAKLENRWITMGRHGFARHGEFELVAQEEASITMRLTPNDAIREQYPFAFVLTITHTLEESGFRTEYTVENAGEKPMPFVIGGHPGFNIPVNEKAAYEDYVIRFEKPETQRCPVIVEENLLDASQVLLALNEEREIPLAHKLFERDALIFEQLNSRKVSLVNPQTGKGVEMEISQFPLLGIWSTKDAPFVCLEPWTGCGTLVTEGDAFEQKKGMQLLPEGEKKEYAFTVRFL